MSFDSTSLAENQTQAIVARESFRFKPEIVPFGFAADPFLSHQLRGDRPQGVIELPQQAAEHFQF
jgi:hypothetical protein